MAESNNVLNKLYKLMGVVNAKTETQPDNTDNKKITRPVHVSQYSLLELRHLPGLNKATQNKDNGRISAQEFIGYMQNSTVDNRNTIRELKQLKELAPEIEQSRRIMVSSILSPNDMQTGQINVSVKVPDLNEEANTALSTMFNDFFNEKLKLGIRLTKWIGDSMFETGSQPVVVLPKWNLDILNAAVDRDVARTGIDNPYMLSSGALAGCQSLIDDIPVSLMSKMSAGVENFNISATASYIDNSASVLCEDIINQIKDLNTFSEYEDMDRRKIAMESMVVTADLLKKNKGFILTHSNPAKVLQSQIHNHQDAADKLQQEVDKYLLGENDHPMLVLKTEGILGDKDHPAILEVPPESVVPVCVPGSISEHVGYFILVDQFGAPITSRVMDQVSSFGSRRLVQSTVDAAYGKPLESIAGNKLNAEQRFAAVSTVFGITLKNLMAHKLDTLGFRGYDVAQHEAIANCMLHHLLQRKKIALIFVPASLMCYYCYGNHDDGTGKAIIEDMKMVIALRTTLVIAGIMAAMRNAMDNKTIEVSIDEKNVGFEQTCDMIRNIFTEKRMLRFDNNPQSVARDIINKSLTIIPKNLKGLPTDLATTVDQKQNQSPLPDDALLTMLSDWAISMIGIPPTALNATKDTEFSRSIATNNIFFSNNIRLKQATTIEITTKFIRLYVKYSKILQTRIKEIIATKGSSTGAGVEGLSEDKTHTSSPSKIETLDEKTVNELVSQVIANLEFTLPTPNIAASKAQIEEVKAYIDVVEQLTAKIFSDELVVSDDPSMKPVMAQMKAIVQLQMIRDYVKHIGLVGTIDIPGFEDIDQEEIRKVTQLIANIKNLNKKSETVFNPPAPDMNAGGDMNNGGGEFGAGGDAGNGELPPSGDMNAGGVPPAEGEQIPPEGEVNAELPPDAGTPGTEVPPENADQTKKLSDADLEFR